MVECANEKVDSLEAGHFDLLINAANEVMIVFSRVNEDADDPVFIYDGRSRAILCKKKGQSPNKVFTQLPIEAREILNAANHILCVEVDNEHIYSEYMAAVEVKH